MEFTIKHNSQKEKILDIMTDYNNISKLVPPQVKSKVIKKENSKSIIEEEISISILKKKIIQRSIHQRKLNDSYLIEVISGPASGTIATLEFKETDLKEIKVNVELKIGFQYRLLSSFIKKKYQVILEELLRKIIGLAELTNGKKWSDCVSHDGNYLTLSEKHSSLKFHNWWQGDLVHIFNEGVYSELDFKGKIVIDIGANIADSSIYFVNKGAKKVIALEPFPKNCIFAEKNITINGYQDKIIFLMAGCSDKVSQIKINDNKFGTSNSLQEFQNGRMIPIETLESIIKKYDINDVVLKLDCEGCEYPVILSTSKEIMRKIEHMVIEYHAGYADIEKKIKEYGFETIVNKNPKKAFANRGYILAHRK